MSLEPYGSPLSLNTIDNISSLGDFVKQNPPGRYIFGKGLADHTNLAAFSFTPGPMVEAATQLRT